MSDCLQKFAADPNLRSVINRKVIGNLIKDNYTILIIFIALSVLLGLVAYYFVDHMRGVIRDYRLYNKKIELAPLPTNNQYDIEADNERYDKDDAKERGDVGLYNIQFRDEPMDYLDKGKKDFLEDVKNQYSNYNILKSQYIKNTYRKSNDDIINEDIMFSKYDDYKYTKKPENDDY